LAGDFPVASFFTSFACLFDPPAFAFDFFERPGERALFAMSTSKMDWPMILSRHPSNHRLAGVTFRSLRGLVNDLDQSAR
jgi:hypothetical protein